MPDWNFICTNISTFAAVGSALAACLSAYFAKQTIDSQRKERRSRVAEEILKFVLKTEELLERIRDPRSKPGDRPKSQDPSAAASILEALNQHEPQKCVSLGIQAEKHLLKDTWKTLSICFCRTRISLCWTSGCSGGEIKESLKELRSILEKMRQCAYPLSLRENYQDPWPPGSGDVTEMQRTLWNFEKLGSMKNYSEEKISYEVRTIQEKITKQLSSFL